MKMRATITIDPEVHAQARKLANRRKTTVSGLIESLLREQASGAASIVDALVGSAELKDPPDAGDQRAENLHRKYLGGG